MYEKYLEQLEEAGKIRNLKERSINCYKNYVSYFLKYQAKPPEHLELQNRSIWCKRQSVIDYLGKYTHRIAISNPVSSVWMRRPLLFQRKITGTKDNGKS